MKNWQQKGKIFLWMLLGVGSIVLMLVAMKKKDEMRCGSIHIAIKGEAETVFISKSDIMEVLGKYGIYTAKSIEGIVLHDVETALEKNAWIADAEIYFDHAQVLHAVITEREPIARIFTAQGSSFYIDSTGMRLPLSDSRTARLPVFTSFPTAQKKLSIPDSLVLDDVKKIALFVAADSFWSAQVAQVNISPRRSYELSMTVGNQLVKIGDAEDLPAKFYRLREFYKQVWPVAGFEKYSCINVQFKGQLVAVKRGAAKPASDTANAMQQVSAVAKRLQTAMKSAVYASDASKPMSSDKNRNKN